MKLWDKGININKMVENFTIGKDKELDLKIAKHDVIGTIAHSIMLNKINLISDSELFSLKKELKEIHQNIEHKNFTIDDTIEDVHSQIEFILTQKLGEVGKKIHSGRSRNDQVLLDLKLYSRDKILEITDKVYTLFKLLIEKSEQYKHILMPGYTHLQVAMPSSFGLWFGAYAESLTDDLQILLGAFHISNQNPLGSAAGYGSSFPLDRDLTTKLLGFKELNYNSVYAQMNRGKMEFTILSAIASLAYTLSKLAMDACLYNCQNFNFIEISKEFTTGSSIMPHKSNPDVFELIRAHTNCLQMLPNQILAISSNLPSGYHRDYQLTKEYFLPAFDKICDCLEITSLMIKNIKVNKNSSKEDRYKYIYSVEEVNNLVKQGVPFRNAYKLIGKQIEKDEFKFNSMLNHTHQGSIGNLCNKQIRAKMDRIINCFDKSSIQKAIDSLLNDT